MFKMHSKSTVEKRLKDIKRRTRKRYTTEEKIRIVLEGIKGETTIAELNSRRSSTLNWPKQMKPSKEVWKKWKKSIDSETRKLPRPYALRHCIREAATTYTI